MIGIGARLQIRVKSTRQLPVRALDRLIVCVCIQTEQPRRRFASGLYGAERWMQLFRNYALGHKRVDTAQEVQKGQHPKPRSPRQRPDLVEAPRFFHRSEHSAVRLVSRAWSQRRMNR